MRGDRGRKVQRRQGSVYLSLLFLSLSCQLGRGGSGTNLAGLDRSWLAPLPLKLPRPGFMSFVRSVDYQDPHLEPFPPPARPAFLAPVGVTNLAYRKLVTTSDRTLRAAARRKLTDGDKEAGDESVVQMAEGKQWVQVDLGSRCAVYAIVIWRHRRGFPICKGMVVQTADDEDFISNVHTWFNNDYENSLGLGVGKDKQYIESSAGKLVDTKGSEARYVRCYSNGMREEKANVYTEIEVWGLPRP